MTTVQTTLDPAPAVKSAATLPWTVARASYQSPFGVLRLYGGPNGLLYLALPNDDPSIGDGWLINRLARDGIQATFVDDPTSLAPVIAELDEYFAGERCEFTVALDPRGTPFQRQVWRALATIPFGVTCSYRDVANAIGAPTATRAVGMANGDNPIAIILPCHRVIGANGKLTGYGGGLELKAKLLAFERGQGQLW